MDVSKCIIYGPERPEVVRSSEVGALPQAFGGSFPMVRLQSVVILQSGNPEHDGGNTPSEDFNRWGLFFLRSRNPLPLMVVEDSDDTR
jgi:hypothetical protein